VRIFLIGPAPPWRGGISHHSSRLAEELSLHHEVELITFSRQYPSFLFPGRNQKEEHRTGLSVPVTASIDSMNPLSWIRVGMELRKRAPALAIFAHSLPFFGPCYGTIAAIARRKKGIRTLFLCHNIIPHERHPGDMLLTRSAFRFADGFLVQSESVRRDLLRLVPDARVAMAHHPVYDGFGAPIGKEEARARLGLPAGKLLLFFGYVRPYKGLRVLLRAISHLDDVTLVVAGEFYEPEASYRSLIADLGIGHRVVVNNTYVPKEEIPAYFSAADAVVAPYLSATQSGIIQLAFNFDKPVIATNVGGLGEVVQPGVTGRLVPPDDPEALARGIREFYERGEEASLRRSLSRRKLEYSWSALAAAAESFMDAGQ